MLFHDRSVAAVCGTGGGGGGAETDFTVVTVEIACLKINCSWLFASRMTEYLSNPLIFPINFTPLIRKTVTGALSRRTVLRYTSWMFWDGVLFSIRNSLKIDERFQIQMDLVLDLFIISRSTKPSNP